MPVDSRLTGSWRMIARSVIKINLKETFMRRDMFLKSLAALAAAGTLPLSALAAANIKMMIPANAGGGWDTTGRALGKALVDSGAASTVIFDNKGGAAGALGLAQFVNGSKGDTHALMVMGAVMLGGQITGKPPVSLSQATPIARLTSEYNVFVLPANSPFKSMAEVIAQLKKDPGSVKWGGGSRGSTEHIAAAMIAREVGVDPSKINYVAFRGGGEATAAILGGNVTIGGSGYSEFAEYITTGKMKALAVTSETRLKGVAVPTLKEQGINVVIGNWRGVYGAPGITPAQRQALTDLVLKAVKTKSWAEASAKNNWTPAVLSGPAFEKFVDDDFASLRATMVKSGMI
jgi:putative tricarboxylic transport membrane protein